MKALDNANISTPNDGLTPIVFPKVKNSSTGGSVEYVPAPNRHWYVLRILYGRTLQMADLLIENGHYAYVAMVWIVEYHDGKKYKRKVPFLNLLFAYLTASEAAEYVKNANDYRFITYYYNHFITDDKGHNPPLTITDYDMSQIIRATFIDSEHVMAVNPKNIKFKSDDEVIVVDGPFKGVKGRVARIARQNRVVILIRGLDMCLITAYIPPYCLRKVD